jgi:hypothetical protein
MLAKSKKGFKRIVGLEDEQKTFGEEFSDAVKLSRTTRMYGFAGCFVAGWVITFLALTALPKIGKQPAKFAILYTAGNIVALCSTMFLWGPVKQIKKMFEPVRAVATIVYFLSMAATLFLAFKVQKLLPVVISLCVQLCAMIWYCASYIPYGRSMIKSCLGI